ncbi:MAG TPA: UDP-3-O-(3-hydroxymyristoyl)glucosamine N-acyltransferase [Flavobacteriales bacterium]|nr:UDP-3-O-(3-hydroxymyristoyl)glucosamine N-acyltransferase [Flavobacteriales bacterium]
MKLEKPTTLQEVAAFLGCEFSGEPSHAITGINEIHVVEPGDIVFVDHPKYYTKALESKATTILINKKVDCPPGKGLLISDDPCRDFNRLNKHYRPTVYITNAIGTNVSIDKTAVIYPNVTIGNNVSIGAGSVLAPGVVIMDHCVIGNNVTIHANTTIGSDAFYYKKREGSYDKMHTCGRVIIHDNVEIGAQCSIDRGLTGDTTIGQGTKIDNQVHIGHDVVIGKNCLFAAQVGIAGCVVIKDNVTLWGQVGIISGVTIGKGATVMGQSGVSEDLEGGKNYFGSPAAEARKKYRDLAAMKIMIENYQIRKG